MGNKVACIRLIYLFELKTFTTSSTHVPFIRLNDFAANFSVFLSEFSVLELFYTYPITKRILRPSTGPTAAFHPWVSYLRNWPLVLQMSVPVRE